MFLVSASVFSEIETYQVTLTDAVGERGGIDTNLI
jgi:hypothetical protein